MLLSTRYDPRTWLVILLLALAGLLLINTDWKLSLAVAVSGGLAWQTGKLSFWWRYCRLLLPMLFLLLLFGALAGEIAAAATSALKLLALSGAAFCFFQLVTPEELAFALLKWRLSFGVAFIISYSLRYVEMLQQEWQTLQEVQQLRGRKLQGRGWRYLPDLLGLMLVQVFRLGDQLAEALEMRGFGSPYRTLPFAYRLTWPDYFLMVVSGLLIVIFTLI